MLKSILNRGDLISTLVSNPIFDVSFPTGGEYDASVIYQINDLMWNILIAKENFDGAFTGYKVVRLYWNVWSIT